MRLRYTCIHLQRSPREANIHELRSPRAVVRPRIACYNGFVMNWWKENKLQRRLYVCIALLFAAAFAYYAIARADTLAGLFAAALSCLLFALCTLRTLDVALSSFTAEPLPSPDARLGRRSSRRDKRHPWARIILFMLITRLFLFALAYALRATGGVYEGGIWDTLQACWLKSDSPSYLGIAENWYVTEGDPRFHIVFFPFYPICIAVCNCITGNSFVSAMLVSSLCAIASAIFIYEIAALDYPRETALRAIKFLFLTPAAFFFAAPMTESLFLLCSLACVYLVRKGHFLWGCLLGALASFTRSLGVILLAFVFVEWLYAFLRAKRIETFGETRKAFIWKGLCMLLIPLGLAGYLFINYAVTGDPFKFMQYQKEHWSQGFGLFFETAAYQTEYALSAAAEGNLRQLFGLWLPNLIYSFGALGLIAAAAKRLRPSYLAYFLAYFAVAIGATWLLSAPRYLAACFPLALGLAACADTRRKDAIATAFSLAGLVAYLAMYVNGYPVY